MATGPPVHFKPQYFSLISLEWKLEKLILNVGPQSRMQGLRFSGQVFSDKSETRSIPPYANLLRTYLVREALAVQGLDGMLWHSQVE